jgi:excisionase family DNA binding protein
MTRQDILADPDRSWCVKEVAAYWGVSEATVRGLIKKGALDYFMVGGCVRVKGQWIQSYEQMNRGRPTESHLVSSTAV